MDRELLLKRAFTGFFFAISIFTSLFESTPVYAANSAIVIDGRTQTQLSQQGNITNVTTNTIKGNNAFNSFSKFDVNTNKTVNLHVPSQSKNLINVVRDKQSQIDGTLNGYKSGKIGGNVYFFNPNGVIVGEQGQINVGSLTIATPTGEYLDKLIDANGQIGDAQTQQAIDGSYPISENGLIRVQGKINAQQAVKINGQQVVVTNNGAVNVGPSSALAFSDLVNMEGNQEALSTARAIHINAQGDVVIGGRLDASGSDNFDGGKIDVLANNNIDLEQGSVISVDGKGANSSAGDIVVYAQDTSTFKQGATISARGGLVSGDAGAIELSAKKVVSLEGGTFEVQAPNGQSGSVLIDPDDIEILSNDQILDGGDYTLIANDSITIGENITVSTRKISGSDHENGDSVGDSGDIELRAEHIDLRAGSKLLAHANKGFASGDILLRASEVDAIGAQRDASASITVTDAKLTGRNITLQAFAETSGILALLENDPSIDLAGAQAYVDGELDDLADGIGGQFIQLDSTANAHTLLSGALIQADGDVVIESKAGARTGFRKNASATITIESSASRRSDILGQSVDILSSASTSLVVPVLGTATELLDQSWLPDPDDSLTETLDEELFGYDNVTLVGLSQANSETLIQNNSLITALKALTISSETESIAKPNFNSPFLFSAAWGESQATAKTRVIGTTTLDATEALIISANNKGETEVVAGLNSTNMPLAATFVHSKNVITTVAETGANTVMSAQSIALKAESEAKTEVSANTQNSGGSGVGVSVAYSKLVTDTRASLGGSVSTTSDGISVEAKTEIIEANKADAANLGDPKTLSNKFTNTQAKANRFIANKVIAATGKLSPKNSESLSNFMFPGIKEGKFNAAGAVAWSDSQHDATAQVAPNASINSAGGLTVDANIRDLLSSNASSKTNSKGSAIGGSASMGNYVSNANAFIGKSATVIAANDVSINAKTEVPFAWEIDWDNAEQVLDYLRGGILDLFLTSYSINSASGKSGLGLAVGLNILELENNAQAYVDEGATINANNVNVIAENDVSVTAASGILSKKFLGSSGGKAAVGGSADLITLSTNAEASIRAGANITSRADVNVNAIDQQRLVSVTVAGGKSEQVGVEGAVSINNLSNRSIAAVDEQAIVLANNLNVTADADLNVTSVAGGVVSTKGPVGIGFSVSINNMVSDVQAFLGNFDPENNNSLAPVGSINTTNKVLVAANTDLLLGSYSIAGALATDSKSQTDVPDSASSTQTGSSSAGGASQSGSGKFGIAVSGDVSLNDLDASTLAYIDNGTQIQSAQNVDLDALSTNEIESLSGAVTISKQANGNGLAGSYSQNTITEDTQAYVNEAQINASDLVSADANTSGRIESLAASITASKGKLGVAGSVAINEIDANTYAGIGLSSVVAGSVLLKSLDNSVIRTIAGALSYGGKAGIGLSFAWNKIGSDVHAWIENSSVASSDEIIIEAENGSTIESISAAIGASKGKLAAAGSLTINTISNTTRAWNSGQLNNLGLTAQNNVEITARDNSEIFALVGSVGASTSTTGVGAAFAWNEINNRVASEALNNALITSNAGNVRVQSLSETQIEAISAGGGFASKVGVGGSVSVVQVNTDIEASVDQSSELNADGSILVLAKDKVDIFSLAGNVSGGGKVAIGIANSTLITNNNVTSRLDGEAQANANRTAIESYDGSFDQDGNANTTADKGLLVQAISSEHIETIAAGGAGGGKAGIAGSATVSDLSESTTAIIGENAQITANLAAADLDQNLVVRASSDSKLLGVAGAIAFGGSAGIGAGADVGVINKSTQAIVDESAILNAQNNLIVEALSQQDITSIAASLGVGGSAGIAGSASVYVIDIITNALINNSAQLLSNGNIVLSASDDNEIDLVAGNFAGGGTAGVGASAAVAIISKTTQALIGQNALITALGNRAAINVNDGGFIRSYTADIDQDGEISGPGTNSDGSDNQALAQQRTSARTTSSLKGLAVVATNKDDLETIAASGSIGGTAAITIAGDVNIIETNTLAQIGDSSQINANNASAGDDQQVLLAAGNDHYQMGIAGSAAGGGTAGIGAAADVLIANHTTQAVLGRNALVKATQSVNVIAQSQQDILSVAAGLAGGGTVGVAGSTSVIDINADTKALILDNATVDSDGNIILLASNSTQTDVVDGTVAIGVGAAGVGGSLGLTQIDKTTQASIGQSANIDARAQHSASYLALDAAPLMTRTARKGLIVEANSSEDVFGVSASGAGGLYAGVSGAVTVSVIDSDTIASIGNNSLINQGIASATPNQQDVNISARNFSQLEMYTGSLGIGAAGVAGGVDVGSVKNDTKAWLGNGVLLFAGNDVGISANTDTDVSSTVVSAAGGVVGIAAGVSVYSLGNGLDDEGQSRLEDDDSGDDVNSYADEQASDNSVETLLAGSDNSRIRDAGARSQQARNQLNLSNDLAAQVPSGTALSIGNSAQIEAGNNVSLSTSQGAQVSQIAGAASVGAVGLGAGVAVLNLDGAASTNVSDNVRISSGNNIQALSHTDNNSSAQAFAGAGGAVAVDAAVAIASDNSTTSTVFGDNVVIDKAKLVTISASDFRVVNTDADGVSVGGAAAVGASVSRSLINGSLSTTIGEGFTVGQDADPDREVTSLSILANSSNHALSSALSAKGGIGLAASGTVADSIIDTHVDAIIGPEAQIYLNEDLNLTATAQSETNADATGVNVAGTAAIGASLATAENRTLVSANLGEDAVLKADNASVEASHSATGLGNKSYALGASGGFLAAINASLASSEDNSQSRALIGDDSQLDLNGSLLLQSSNNTLQNAKVSGVTIGGLLAAGLTESEALSNTQSLAQLGEGVTVNNSSGSVDIQALGTDNNFSEAISGSGGLIAGSAAEARTTSVSNTHTSIGDSSVINAKNFGLLAEHMTQYNALVNSISASLAGASGAQSVHSVNSSVSGSIGANATVNTQSFDLDAINRIYKFWIGSNSKTADAAANSDDASWNIQSGSGGAINAPSGRTENDILSTTLASIGTDAIIHMLMPASGEAQFYMDVLSDIVVRDKAKLDSGGLIALARTETNIDIDVNNEVLIASGAQLLSDLGDINIGSRSLASLDARASSDTYGLAGAPEGEARINYNVNSNTLVDANATLNADDGNIWLAAGRSSDQQRSTIDAATEVRLWNKTAIPINSTPDAHTYVSSNADLKLATGSNVLTSEDISLVADKGNISVSHIGIGKDVYRELAAGIASGISNAFGGGDVSFDIKGGSSRASGQSDIVVDGLALAGTRRSASLNLDYQLVDANGFDTNTPVYDPDTGNVLWRLVTTQTDGVTTSIERSQSIAGKIQERIDKLRDLINDYSGDAAAVAAYEAEIKFLQFKLTEVGLADGNPYDDGNDAYNPGAWKSPSPKEATEQEIVYKNNQLDSLDFDIDANQDESLGFVTNIINDQSSLSAAANSAQANAGGMNTNNDSIDAQLRAMDNFNAADSQYLSLQAKEGIASGLSGDIATVNNANDDLNAQIDNANDDMQAWQTTIVSNQATIDAERLKGSPDLDLIEMKRDENNGLRQDISAKLLSIESDLNTIDSNNALIATDTASLQSTLSDIDTLQGSLSTAFAKAGDDDAKVTAVTHLRNANIILDSSLSSNKSTIDSSKQSVNTHVASNQGKVSDIDTWEGDFLVAQTELQQLENDLPNQSDVSPNGATADFVTVDPIKVTLGSIDIWADNLSGSGDIRAPGDAKIEITNNTPNFLIIGDLEIDSDSGGEIRFNNGFINSNSDVTKANLNQSSNSLEFDSKFLRSNSNQPEIMITSKYDPNSPVFANILAPAPDIKLAGDVKNEFGSVRVHSAAGSIFVEGNIRAASVDVKAENGDFVQSYVDGFFHSSGDPAENNQGNPESNVSPGSGIIANGSVVISARYLNINGLVQSGIDDLYIDLGQDPTLTGSVSMFNTENLYGVSQADLIDYRERYSNNQVGYRLEIHKADGQGELYYNAELDRLEASIEYADWDIAQTGRADAMAAFAGLYKIVEDNGNIGASYDPSIDNGRYVLDGELVSGGYIQLFGQILNTNSNDVSSQDSARLKVIDGFGQINITNTSDRAIVINNLSTGRDNSGIGNGIEGVIDITDIQFVDEVSGEVNAIHSVYTRIGDQILLEQTGGWDGNVFDPNYSYEGLDTLASDARNSSYAPQEGLDYVWKKATTEKQVTDWKFTGTRFVGITVSQGKPTGTPDKVSSEPKTTRRLNDATMIEVNKGPKADDYYDVKRPEIDVSADKWVKKDEWSDCNWWTLCTVSDYTSLWTQTYGYTEITTYKLKADNPIAIEFSGANTGSVSILSKSDVHLNGYVDNRHGTTTITAGIGNPFAGVQANSAALLQDEQSILQGERGVLIGNNFNFASSKSIGIAGDTPDPVLIDINGGTLNVSVANGDLSLRQRSGDLIVGQLSALGDVGLDQGRLYLAAEGSILSEDNNSYIQAHSMNLISDNGALGSTENPLNIQLGFDADFANRNRYGINAQAKDDIHIQSQAWASNSEADLLVNSIESVSGNVSVRTPGKVLDNSPFEKIDQRTFDELKGLWDSLALLEGTGNNQAKQDQAIASFENQGTQDYRDYWQLRDEQSNPGVYDPNFTAALSAQQESALRESLAKQGKTQAQADDFIDDYNQQRRDRYHALHNKLYVIDEREYTNAMPDSFDDNYRYSASSRERADLTNGASWTEKQLAIALSPGLIKQVTDTNPVLKDPNISGRQVSIFADAGIGETLPDRIIDLNQNPADFLDADKVALAGAEREDLSVDDNGIATVTERKALNISDKEGLVALSQNETMVNGDVFINSEADVNVEQLWASGLLRLKTNGSIRQINSVLPAFIASSLILESAQGAIGSEQQRINIQLNNNAPLIARAAQDIWLGQDNLDLAIDTIYSREDVDVLAGGSIKDAFDDDQVNILARQITLDSQQSIGGSDNFFDVSLAASFDETPEDELSWLKTNSLGASYIRALDQVLSIKSASAGSDLSVVSENDIEVQGLVTSILDTSLTSGSDVLINGRLEAGNRLSVIANNISTSAKITAGQNVDLIANFDARIGGEMNANALNVDANNLEVNALTSILSSAIVSVGNNLTLRSVLSSGLIKVQAANDLLFDQGVLTAQNLMLSAGHNISSNSLGGVDIIAQVTQLEAGNSIGTDNALRINTNDAQLESANINVIADSLTKLTISASGQNNSLAQIISIAANSASAIDFEALYSNVALVDVTTPVLRVLDGISSLYAQFYTPYTSARVDAIPAANDGLNDVRIYTPDQTYTLYVDSSKLETNGYLITKDPNIDAQGAVASSANLVVNESLTGLRNQQIGTQSDELEKQGTLGDRPEVLSISPELF